MESDHTEMDPPALAASALDGNQTPALDGKKAWNSAIEQEWSEHSATAWALAHVIHHIRSTPLPPFLLPEQQRHFQKIILMAAALMEEWQRSERDQAQQLAIGRPVTGLPMAADPEEPAAEQEPDEARQNHTL
ncbi:MAG TPA: hypothetical protein VH599_07805 [Ktedonobacterales bacterium]|jgi:hypothetical protein